MRGACCYRRSAHLLPRGEKGSRRSSPFQHGDVEPVDIVARGREPQARPMRRGGAVQRLQPGQPQGFARIFAAKVGVLRKEGRDPVLVFLAQQRAGDVDQPPAGPHIRAPARKNLVLRLLSLLQRAGPRAPFGVGIAPPGSHAGAGRVDHAPDRIGRRGRRRDRFFRGAPGPRRFSRRPAPAARKSASAAARRNRWRTVRPCCPCRRQRQRLAAAARAKVENFFTRNCAA